MNRWAITREVSSSIGECELTHVARAPIDVDKARAQHARYAECLARLGCDVIRLPEEPGMPDSLFVEDTAIVLDELAIITRPGAMSRRGESEAVETALRPFRETARIDPPATIDGGDVLVIGRRIFVGRSARTNDHAIEQVRQLVEPLGYRVRAVDVSGCLHLKSAAAGVSEGVILVNDVWIDPSVFEPLETIPIDPGEPHAANALRIGEVLIYPSTFPRTAERLEKRGIRLELVDLSELAKAEGAVTCCSLIFSDDLMP